MVPTHVDWHSSQIRGTVELVMVAKMLIPEEGGSQDGLPYTTPKRRPMSGPGVRREE